MEVEGGRIYLELGDATALFRPGAKWQLVGEGRSSVVVAPIDQKGAQDLESILSAVVGEKPRNLADGVCFVLRLRKRPDHHPSSPTTPGSILDANAGQCATCAYHLKAFLGTSVSLRLRISDGWPSESTEASFDSSVSIEVRVREHSSRSCNDARRHFHIPCDVEGRFSCQLMPNFVQPFPGQYQRYISFEIKPKAATLIPLAEFCSAESRSGNMLPCRFSMMQQEKRMRSKLSGSPFVVSRYCPNDLFSLREEQMVCALEQLVATPQNNLIIRIDGVPATFAAASSLVPEVLEVITTALKDSEVLQRILELQALSVGVDIAQLTHGGCEAVESAFVVDPSCACRSKQKNRLFQAPTPATVLSAAVLCATLLTPIERFYVATTARDCSVIVTVAVGDARTANAPTVDTKLEGCVSLRSYGYECFVAIVDVDDKRSKTLDHYARLEQRIVDAFRASESETL